MTGTLSRPGLQAEEAILAGILSGADFDFAELTPEEFFLPLHRKLYARLRVMNAMEEPVNILAVLEPMRLDAMDAAAVHALHDPLYGPFTPEHIRGHVKRVKRDARH